MNSRRDVGWAKLLKGFPWYNAERKYPLQAYSEFMPAMKAGINPSDGSIYPWVFREDDLFGWQILEIEEEYQLRPGLEKVGLNIIRHIVQLGTGTLPVQLAGHQGRNLANNLFWPRSLASHQGRLKHERYVMVQPYSLSKTKDDKGRVCWTFFGGSEQGPEKAFWKSFYESPGKELPESRFLSLMRWIFQQAYGIRVKNADHLRSLGFRILPAGDAFPFSYWKTQRLPSWTKGYLLEGRDGVDAVRYLLTFRPFDRLPARVKEKYISGTLNLLPFPGSMALWGIPEYIRLQRVLYNAIQMPMLRLVKRDEGFSGLRVPQSGWAHQPKIPGEKAKILEEFIVNNYVRTSRFDRIRRDEDALLKSTEIDPVIQTLFSTTLEALDLYNKPMARNCQLLNENIELLLDGPRADRRKIGEAALKAMAGGLFRYRFYFPPMQVGLHEVFWHRPLVACVSRETEKPVLAPPDLITGYLTGYHTDHPDPADAVELWPRLRRRDESLYALHNFDRGRDRYWRQTSFNVMALLDAWEMMWNRRLARDFARAVVRIPRRESLEGWLASLAEKSLDRRKNKKMIHFVRGILESEEKTHPPTDHLTFGDTARRVYEEAYWNEIHFMAHGKFTNKDNADVVQDQETLRVATHRGRDLHELGDYLIQRHREAIAAAGMEGKAQVGEMPFRWETDFEFTEFGGWRANQDGSEYERNLLVIIPGKNRREAVVMADHYDTAYMGDVFDRTLGGSGARISAAGADDNYSATATLLLAAPIFLKLSKEGRLERDIWLLHLTGEEFPSDCLGARNFCQNVVQRTLRMRDGDNCWTDLSQVQIKGVLVIDMIANNRDKGRDIFQISPGKTGYSLRLAHQALRACQAWNGNVPAWNKSPDRKGCRRGQRTKDLHVMPPKALHLKVEGEIRTWEDPKSSLYNTDGMIFSDTGIPVILFMENYDIDRTGYHDTHDTMENIDLDYGAAVSAIAIETIARVAVS